MFYFTPYIILPLLSAIITGFLAVYAWKRRSVPAARPLFGIVVSLSGWSLAYGISIASSELAIKIICYKIAVTFACTASPALLYLSLISVGLSRWLTPGRWVFILIIPLISIGAAWTSELHALHRYGFYLYESGPLWLIGFQEGPLFRMHALYILFVDCLAMVILVCGFFRYPKSEWPRFALLIIAVLIPLVVEFAIITPVKGFALISSSFFLTGIFLTSAVFHYRLLDLLPLARTTLFDQIGEPVLVYDSNGNFVACNVSAAQLLGNDIQQGVCSRFPSLQAKISPCGKEIAEDSVIDMWDPQRCWRITSSVLKAGVIQGRMFLLHDVSILKQTERRLMESEANLQGLNQSLRKRVDEEISQRMMQEHLLANQSRLVAMGQMINAIAHQWRQPLATLGMIIQRVHAMGTMKTLTQEQLDEFKASAMQQIAHMSDTIEEFRGFYRPEKKQEPFVPESCITSAIRLFGRQFTSSGISVELCCEESARRSITGFPNEFKQVILNLLSNARDAIVDSRIVSGQPEKGMIKVDIAVKDEKVMIFDVSDNGRGIRPEIADRIFEPFFTTKENMGGSGIGLYISRMIVEDSLKGRILLVPGQSGATFRVELPLEEST